MRTEEEWGGVWTCSECGGEVCHVIGTWALSSSISVADRTLDDISSVAPSGTLSWWSVRASSNAVPYHRRVSFLRGEIDSFWQIWPFRSATVAPSVSSSSTGSLEASDLMATRWGEAAKGAARDMSQER